MEANNNIENTEVVSNVQPIADEHSMVTSNDSREESQTVSDVQLIVEPDAKPIESIEEVVLTNVPIEECTPLVEVYVPAVKRSYEHLLGKKTVTVFETD